MGVRKAQVKLAAYYISHRPRRSRPRHRPRHARRAARALLKIRRQLDTVESKEFWEIIDRGRNFEYMPPKQRACLATYFEWLNVEGAPPEAAPAPAPEEPNPAPTLTNQK